MLSEAMTARIGTLSDYAISTGASGVLFTCSASGMRSSRQPPGRRSLS